MSTRQSHRATILDVARAAEVSRQTVSNVVNSPHKVAPDTLVRVQAEIDRLGFRPSRAARTLKQERAGAWGLEIDARGAGRLGSVLDAFLVELTLTSSRNDTHILPFAAPDYREPIAAYEEVLASRLADGFILTDTRHDDPRPQWLRDRGIPFAAFGRVWDDPTETAWVDVDGAAGVETAVSHLVDEGYQRVAFLGWPTGSPVGDDRRAGWARAVDRLGVGNEAWQGVAVQELDAATLAARPLVDIVGPGGAIVCASDALAAGVWRAVHERGLRPGLDVGIVGFDDTDAARVLGLTTLRQPLTEITERVLAILLNAQTPPAAGTVLHPELVRRSSSSRTVIPPAR